MRILRVAASAVISVAMLTACASGPNLSSATNPGADFSRYRTYGFHPDITGGGLSETTVYTEIIKRAVGREMQLRGYSYSTRPDMLVNFRLFGHVRQETRSTGTPSMDMRYARGPYGYRGSAWSVGYTTSSTEIRNFTEGTLVIDLVDPRLNAQMWTGRVVGRVSEQQLRNPTGTLNNAVGAIMDMFLVAAGGHLYVPPDS